MLVKSLLLNMPEHIYKPMAHTAKQEQTPRTKFINNAVQYYLENKDQKISNHIEEDQSAPPVFFSSSGTGF